MLGSSANVDIAGAGARFRSGAVVRAAAHSATVGTTLDQEFVNLYGHDVVRE